MTHRWIINHDEFVERFGPHPGFDTDFAAGYRYHRRLHQWCQAVAADEARRLQEEAELEVEVRLVSMGIQKRPWVAPRPIRLQQTSQTQFQPKKPPIVCQMPRLLAGFLDLFAIK